MYVFRGSRVTIMFCSDCNFKYLANEIFNKNQDFNVSLGG